MAVTNPPAHHGNKGVLYMSTSRAGAMKPVALISEWTLDMASDKVETTALGDRNKTYCQGLRDTKGSLTGFWNSLDDAMFAAAESGDGIMLGIYPSELDPATYFVGPAWLDVNIKGGVASAVSLEGTFSANGAWTRSGTSVP
jgi:hypothetical protein